MSNSMGIVTRRRAEVFDLFQLISQNFNDHQLHAVIHLSSHIDSARLKRAVALSTDALPEIRSRYVEENKHAYWQDCGNTNGMVKIVESDDVSTDEARCITYKTNELTGPQLKLFILKGNQSDTLIVIINHMIVDAAGFKDYLYLLCSIYSHLYRDPGYSPMFKPGNRSLGQITGRLNPIKKTAALLSRGSLDSHGDSVIFPLEGNSGSPFIVIHKIGAEKFAILKSYAKKNMATINDVVMAAYIRALVGHLRVKPFPVACMVDLRKYLPGRRAEGMCNLTSTLVCNIGNDAGETLEETVKKVKTSLDAEKSSTACLKGPLLSRIVFGLLPYQKAKDKISSSFVNPGIAMTNIGIIDKKRLVFEGLDVTDMYMTGSIKYKPYFQVALSTFNNSATFSINFHGTAGDRETIAGFLELLENELPG